MQKFEKDFSTSQRQVVIELFERKAKDKLPLLKIDTLVNQGDPFLIS